MLVSNVPVRRQLTTHAFIQVASHSVCFLFDLFLFRFCRPVTANFPLGESRRFCNTPDACRLCSNSLVCNTFVFARLFRL